MLDCIVLYNRKELLVQISMDGKQRKCETEKSLMSRQNGQREGNDDRKRELG